ncbi:cation:proton antiporter [Actinomadura darangshiensis]|uniref:cation:proton antiporter domain-containing protein n=1 Tax=Actinomadura darangshiensis TaxID=705336 RepID=UPI00140DD201|nr:cation:proton antiporter [Actinomadura darangshiensis]
MRVRPVRRRRASLTAFPVLARILYERGLENSPLGRLSLLAAPIDDAVAWCLLAVLTAWHPGGLAQGMITRELFAMLVLVALVTTAAAVPLYRLALPERLERARMPAGDQDEPAATSVQM